MANISFDKDFVSYEKLALKANSKRKLQNILYMQRNSSIRR